MERFTVIIPIGPPIFLLMKTTDIVGRSVKISVEKQILF